MLSPSVSLSQLFAIAFSNHKIRNFLLVLRQSVGTPVAKTKFYWLRRCENSGQKTFPCSRHPQSERGLGDSRQAAVNCDNRFKIQTVSQLAHYGRILRSTLTTANSMSLKILGFFCHYGKNLYLEGVVTRSVQHRNFQQQSVRVGLPQSHKAAYAFEQVWVARTLKNRKYFEKGRGGGLLHPPVFAPAVCERCRGWLREAGAGAEAPGQSRRRRASSTSPAHSSSGGAGRPTALPQVTPAAALGSAFLRFGFSGVWLLLFLCRHFCPTLEFGLACALVLSDLGSSHKSLAHFVWALKYGI